MVAIITLLVVVSISLIVNRIASVALTFTGLSRDSARFQARSAFSGAGFTTSESELIVQHPVRRKIIMMLMFAGNAGFVTMIATLMGGFVGLNAGGNAAFSGAEFRVVSPEGEEAPNFSVEIVESVPETESSFRDHIFGSTPFQQATARFLVLVLGILFLWMVSSSKWVDAQMFKVISWALKRFTSLDTQDYHGILHLSEGFSVDELEVSQGHWVAGRPLMDLKLSAEGVHVLGIMRADKTYVGTPTGNTYVRNGDTLILYGRVEHLRELKHRGADDEGQHAHERHLEEQEQAPEGVTGDERRRERTADGEERRRDRIAKVAE